MKIKLEYLKKFCKTLFWPLILSLSQFILIVLFTLFFNMQYLNSLKVQYPTLNNNQINDKFQEILNSNKYVQELSGFLTDKSVIMIILLALIILPIITKKYNSLKKDKITKLANKEYIKIIITSIFMAVVLNLIMFLFNKLIPFTNRYDSSSTKFYMIISTGIIVPILEEYIFRGMVFNELKTFNTKKIALILTTILFALMHTEISQIIYALIIGSYLIYLYTKTNDIKVSIMAHIAINTSTIIFLPFIMSVNVFIQIGLIVILGLGIYQHFKSNDIK